MICALANRIVAISSLTMLIGCSPNYLPIGDHKVFIDAYFPLDEPEGTTQALFCTEDESVCGRREEEGYDPDEFVLYTDDDIANDLDPFPYFWKKAKAQQGNMQAGRFEIGGVVANTGDILRTSLNDLAWAEVKVPSRFSIITPDYFSEPSRKQAQTLDVTWEPSNQGFPMIWDLFLADLEPEETTCDLLGWKGAKGEVEDTGSLQIPLDGLPSEIPAEGCDAVLILRLRNEGTLPPEFPRGYVRSETLRGVVFRFMP